MNMSNVLLLSSSILIRCLSFEGYMEDNMGVGDGVTKQMHQGNDRVQFMNRNVKVFPRWREAPLDEVRHNCSSEPRLGAVRCEMQQVRVSGSQVLL